MPKGRILVVDDDRVSRTICADALVEDGYEVETASTGSESLEMIRTRAFDLVVLDLVLPDLNGEEVLKRIRQINAFMSVIIITGHSSVDSAIDCLKGGASDYLTKPLNPEEFRFYVNRTIEQKRLFEENTGLKRLIRLYEVSRLISSCLGYERFYEVVLDSLFQIVEGKMGLSIFSDEEHPDLRLTVFRGCDEETAASLANPLISYLKKSQALDMKPQVPTVDSEALGLSSQEVGPLLLVPIKKKDAITGYVAIFKHPDGIYSDTDTENASFISDEASLSLENVQLYNQAKELTYIDDVTKLYNVRYMDIALDNEIKRAKRFASQLSLLFIDIDYFKRINDTHGHEVGTRALFELGQLLREIVREVDTVIRYGGDEFTLLLVETNSAGAMIIGERIRTAVEKHIFLSEEGLSVRFTITIGIATYPEQSADKTELLTFADHAMYKGKRTTRNVVVLAENISPLCLNSNTRFQGRYEK